MPNTHYAQLWLDARADLEKLMADDRSVQEGKLIEDRSVAVNTMLKLYFRYRRAVQRLTSCHDQIVQPQIRELAGRQLDYSIARMLECRRELVDLTFLECPWPNDLLLDMKLTPEDVQLTAPAYDAPAREAEVARRKKLVDDDADSKQMEQESGVLSEVSSLQTYAESEAEAEDSKSAIRGQRRQRGNNKSRMSVAVEAAPKKETPEQRVQRELKEAQEREFRRAITLIQSHERARVARRVAKNAILDREFRAKLASSEPTTSRKVIEDPAKRERAASVIQRCWRRFSARRRYEKRIERLERLLGMTMPSWTSPRTARLAEQAFRERLDDQVAAVKDRDALVEAQRKKLWEVRAPGLIEDIRDEIREWLLDWYNELGYFDSIPAAEDGGSLLIATGQVRTPAEYLAAPPEDKSKKKKQDDQKGDEEEEDEELEPEGWKMSESKAFPLLVEANEEFQEHWSRRTEQILDPLARPIVELITEPLCHEMQLRVRPAADEYMRGQLAELNQALIADSIENGEKGFEMPKRQVFEKPEPEAKVKERVDPLADIPEDELMLELSRQQVLRDCPKERLSDWPGALSYEIKETARGDCCLGDLLQPVMDYCVLPFGSKRVNQLAPTIRSVCLCGPPDCGQLFIARAICAELKATVFDLTPERHVGRFLQRSKQDHLVRAVLKLARAYAPSVVLVEDESAFLKKVPVEMRRVQPKRFAAVYRKIVKGIQPGDQVLFLTASQQPYMAARSFLKLHDKFIVVPVADYGTLYRLYKNALMSRPSVDRHIDVSCLARISVLARLPLQLASRAVQLASTIRRRMKFRRQPMRSEEILEKVFQLTGVPGKEFDSFAKFRAGLPLELLRLEWELEQAEQQQDKKKK